MGLEKMKLGVKIGVGFGIILLLLVVITVIAIIQLNNLSVEIANINNKENEKLELAYKLIDQSKDIVAGEKSMALADAINRSQYPPIIEEMQNDYFLTLDKLTKQSATPKSKQLCALVKQSEAASKSVTRELMDTLIKAGDNIDITVKQIFVKVDLQQDTQVGNVKALLDLQKVEKAQAVSDAQRSYLLKGSVWMLSLGALAFVLGGFIAYFLSKSIVGPISRVAEGLLDAAEQVASASSQVSQSSQALAQDATEQASSLEETSASMEEMATMTRNNADNANQANALIQANNSVVKETDEAMSELYDFMKDITRASEETGKIIKTIDEIAFQTNLLALNAAVEAARAGASGAGFAVVADEVRTLAKRAADAAGNTAVLIENTVKKTKSGLALVDKTNQSFKQVSEGSKKVAVLVDEITTSSNEQARGIDQINKAVVEIDKIVQQNVANAEESAAASEEMTAQAQQMKQFVDQLISVVGSKNQDADSGGEPLMLAREPNQQEALCPAD